MGKKRIAIFAENLYGGGVEKILQIICGNFDYTRYDVTLYASRREAMPVGTYPESLTIKYIFSNGNGFWSKLKNKIKLLVYYHCSPSFYYKLFIRETYDVGIAFIEGYATRFLSGAPKEMKKIAWLHTDIENNHWTDVAFHDRTDEKACYQAFATVVCVSNIVEKRAKEFLELTNTMVLQNPIETEKIHELSNDAMGVPKQHGLRIVSIGSLIQVKGYDRLLKAVKKLKADNMDFELLILGDGVERGTYETYIEKNNLNDNVKLIGFVDNPYPLLKSADVYVCSSYAEGFNTAITEALVLGRAIVATEVSGVREQLGLSCEYGIIIENSEDGIYSGLKQMMQPGCIEYYQSQAKKRGKTFSLDNQMCKIYNLIES